MGIGFLTFWEMQSDMGTQPAGEHGSVSHHNNISKLKIFRLLFLLPEKLKFSAEQRLVLH